MSLMKLLQWALCQKTATPLCSHGWNNAIHQSIMWSAGQRTLLSTISLGYRYQCLITFVHLFVVVVSYRRGSRRCLGSTTNRRLSRCSKASGEFGSTSAPQRPQPALALSCTSQSSTARSWNSTLPKWVSVGVWERAGTGPGTWTI